MQKMCKVKALSDGVAAGCLIVFTLPLIVITAIAVKLSSPGPVFVHQYRLSAGRRVPIFQFRTTDAPQRIVSARSQGETTRVGWLLRYTRIDVLPQLFNVLRGDMSLLGTRQERVDLLDAQ
jgi:lipopolysaccharide/colanic/teichoic acid biosynthesis glycosyltransferase